MSLGEFPGRDEPDDEHQISFSPRRRFVPHLRPSCGVKQNTNAQKKGIMRFISSSDIFKCFLLNEIVDNVSVDIG